MEAWEKKELAKVKREKKKEKREKEQKEATERAFLKEQEDYKAEFFMYGNRSVMSFPFFFCTKRYVAVDHTSTANVLTIFYFQRQTLPQKPFLTSRY